MSREPSTRAAARSGFADLTIVVACAVIAPQIVLRAVAAPRQNAGTVAVAALAAMVFDEHEDVVDVDVDLLDELHFEDELIRDRFLLHL